MWACERGSGPDRELAGSVARFGRVDRRSTGCLKDEEGWLWLWCSEVCAVFVLFDLYPVYEA